MSDDLPILDLSNSLHRKLLIERIKTLRGMHKVVITKCRNQRSLAQNDYFHGVVLPLITQGIRDVTGEDADPAQVKVDLKMRFEQTPVVNKETGEIVMHKLDSTADYDVQRMSGFIEKCIQFALDYLGVTVPPAAQYATDPVSPVPASVGNGGGGIS